MKQKIFILPIMNNDIYKVFVFYCCYTITCMVECRKIGTEIYYGTFYIWLGYCFSSGYYR